MKKGTRKSSSKRSRKTSKKKSSTSKAAVDNMKYEIAREFDNNSSCSDCKNCRNCSLSNRGRSR